MTPWVVGLVGTIQASCAGPRSLLSPGNTSFYLGFLSELLITVIRAAAINNVLARPVNVRSIWSQARPGHWEPPTDFIVSNWNMQRLNEYISYHSPHSLLSQTSHLSVSYLLPFLGLQTSTIEWLHFLQMWEQWCDLGCNYQAVNSVSEQTQFATNTWDNQLLAKSAALLWTRVEWNSNVLMIDLPPSPIPQLPLQEQLVGVVEVNSTGWLNSETNLVFK